MDIFKVKIFLIIIFFMCVHILYGQNQKKNIYLEDPTTWII
jgi:hypothetical protein